MSDGELSPWSDSPAAAATAHGSVVEQRIRADVVLENRFMDIPQEKIKVVLLREQSVSQSSKVRDGEASPTGDNLHLTCEPQVEDGDRLASLSRDHRMSTLLSSEAQTMKWLDVEAVFYAEMDEEEDEKTYIKLLDAVAHADATDDTIRSYLAIATAAFAQQEEEEEERDYDTYFVRQ